MPNRGLGPCVCGARLQCGADQERKKHPFNHTQSARVRAGFNALAAVRGRGPANGGLAGGLQFGVSVAESVHFPTGRAGASVLRQSQGRGELVSRTKKC